MEQLATGLNKAAQAMQTEEAEAEVGGPPVSSDLGNLEDRQLFQLLEEAYDYRGGTKDRDGKSEMFRVCLMFNVHTFTVLTLQLQMQQSIAKLGTRWLHWIKRNSQLWKILQIIIIKSPFVDLSFDVSFAPVQFFYISSF